MAIDIGVSQGSILGPILFLFFFLYNTTEVNISGTICFFGDDIGITWNLPDIQLFQKTQSMLPIFLNLIG